jgi:hypothetical protein
MKNMPISIVIANNELFFMTDLLASLAAKSIRELPI